MRSNAIFVLLAGVLIYVLFWRWQVSATRFFDVDEFSYMHWTAQVAHGQLQYVDFLSYFTPGFFWAYTPIFWIMGRSVQVFAAGRAVSFVIFLGILGSVSYLWGITRGWRWALLPAVMLAFLPMPYDKFLEIRPDNLSTFLAIIGVVGEIRALQVKKPVWWIVAGLFYSASLFVLTKTLPIVAIGGVIAVSALWPTWKKFLYFGAGLFGPWILFFGGTALSGHFSQVWYSLTRLPFEAYKSALNFPMEADLFFFPNASFYGGNGHTLTLGLITNHSIWLLAILFGVYRLFTADRKNFLSEILMALIFFVQILGYVKYFPAKHSQYLIPIAVFVAYYAADGLSLFFNWLIRAGGYTSVFIALIGLGYLLGAVTQDITRPKLALPNTTQLAETTKLLATIPAASRVVDLEGRMLFWPEGYHMCCMTIDPLLANATRRPEPFSEYLAKNQAEYIWDGTSDRLQTFNKANQEYIREHYDPVPEWGNRLYALRRLQ